MRSYTKTVYVSDDGKEFDDDQECRRHEYAAGIIDWLAQDPDLCLRSSERQDVVFSLLKKYDIIERKEP